MAAFEDPDALRRDLHASAFPTLQALEANPAMLDRSRRRFDHESPPPYASSTEEESEPEPDHVSRTTIEKVLDEPLSEAELDNLGEIAIRQFYAGRKMWGEYKAELHHLDLFCDVYGVDPPLTRLLKYRIHKQRLHILARSGVRRRWQTFGVWNNDWGAVDCTKPNRRFSESECVLDDDGKPWAWDWVEKDIARDKTHPAWRAVRLLRAGLRREEFPVPPPRHNLTSGSSASEKESFITSRPWFQFVISVNEENIRLSRLSRAQLQRADLSRSLFQIVRERWESKGLWRSSWDRRRPDGNAGWKWPHESPSPEPENYVNYDPDALDKHLSPSELDEYERIVPTPPNTPPTDLWPFWHPEEEKDRPIWKAPPPPEYRETAVTPSPLPPSPKPKPKSKPKPAKKRTPAPRRTQASRPPARAQKPRPTKNSTTSAASAEPRRSARIAARQAQGAQKELLADEEEARKQQQRRTQSKTKTTQSQAKTAQSKTKTTQSQAKTTQSKTKTTQRARRGGVAAAAKKETAKNAKAPAQSRKRKRK